MMCTILISATMQWVKVFWRKEVERCSVVSKVLKDRRKDVNREELVERKPRKEIRYRIQDLSNWLRSLQLTYERWIKNKRSEVQLTKKSNQSMLTKSYLKKRKKITRVLCPIQSRGSSQPGPHRCRFLGGSDAQPWSRQNFRIPFDPQPLWFEQVCLLSHLGNSNRE